MDEESYKTHQELWEQYMEVERRELEQRMKRTTGPGDRPRAPRRVA
jgi:hypothetical protein